MVVQLADEGAVVVRGVLGLVDGRNSIGVAAFG